MKSVVYERVLLRHYSYSLLSAVQLNNVNCINLEGSLSRFVSGTQSISFTNWDTFLSVWVRPKGTFGKKRTLDDDLKTD